MHGGGANSMVVLPELLHPQPVDGGGGGGVRMRKLKKQMAPLLMVLAGGGAAAAANAASRYQALFGQLLQEGQRERAKTRKEEQLLRKHLHLVLEP